MPQVRTTTGRPATVHSGPHDVSGVEDHHGCVLRVDLLSGAAEPPKRNEFERWRAEYPRGTDESARQAAKPRDIAYAELILGAMREFNYPNIRAVLDEDVELIRLMECERWGFKMDQEEEYAEQQAEHEAQMRQQEAEMRR